MGTTFQATGSQDMIHVSRAFTATATPSVNQVDLVFGDAIRADDTIMVRHSHDWLNHMLNFSFHILF